MCGKVPIKIKPTPTRANTSKRHTHAKHVVARPVIDMHRGMKNDDSFSIIPRKEKLAASLSDAQHVPKHRQDWNELVANKSRKLCMQITRQNLFSTKKEKRALRGSKGKELKFSCQPIVF